jgi:DNA replication protein DnaC
MNQQQEIEQYCRRYKIMGMAPKIDELVKKAETEQLSYMNFLVHLFEQEALHRDKQAKERLLKTAQLPTKSNLDQYEQREESGLTKQKTNTLREMAWLDQMYNIMIMGPSGVGKTMLAPGLCADAIEKGYKAYFRTMEEIITMLKAKDFRGAAMADHKRLTKASLIVIDDVMLFPVEKARG